VRLEAGTRSFGVALQDEAFGLRGVETLVVPAGLFFFEALSAGCF
jgi:hypothetical protein